MKRYDILYMVLGAFYLVAGMLLGIVMGIRQDYQLAPAHAHINLVGFAAHSAFGLACKSWPGLAQSRMATGQFWLFVLGSPLLMAGIVIALKTGNPAVAIIGSLLVTLGALLFLLMTLGLLRARSS